MAELSITDAIEGVNAGTAPAGPGQTPEQLKTLAAQFESLLLGQMMREMRKSMFDDDNEKDNALGGGPLADTMFAELSVALSRAGGIGLSGTILAPLMKEAGVTAGTIDVPPSVTLPGTFDAPISGVPVSATGYALPGRLSSGFGWRKDPVSGDEKFHNGLDLALAVGADVPVARGGEVSFAGQMEGYGLTVVVKHDGQTSTRYAHLSEILVNRGDAVRAGQTIALSGNTGRSTGPHLHFEVLRDGQAVDPATGW